MDVPVYDRSFHNHKLHPRLSLFYKRMPYSETKPKKPADSVTFDS